MTAPTVHLVRHAEVQNPHHVVYASLPGFGLSERGRRQARAMADHLAERPIASILSSPLRRACETADALADRAALPVTTDERLLEWSLGERWAGTSWDHLDVEFPGELAAYLTHPEDLAFSPESLADLASRVRAAVDDATESGGNEAVVVSHQDPIQAVRLLLTERPLSDLQHDKPGHCSVVTMTRHYSGWQETAYWQPPQGPGFPPIRSNA